MRQEEKGNKNRKEGGAEGHIELREKSGIESAKSAMKLDLIMDAVQSPKTRISLSPHQAQTSYLIQR